MITPDDERRYKLPPLPAVRFRGRLWSAFLRWRYERHRRRYRRANPLTPRRG